MVTRTPTDGLQAELDAAVKALEREIDELEERADELRVAVGELLEQVEEAEAEAAMFASSSSSEEEGAAAEEPRKTDKRAEPDLLQLELVTQQGALSQLESRLEAAAAELVAVSLHRIEIGNGEP